MNELPFVSIVVPNYNNLKGLMRCMECISRLDYPKEKLEIIVIDNNSKDRRKVRDFIQAQGNIRFFEYKSFQSPYPCRNIGVKAAKGNFIALLDSNCFPVAAWMREGIACLLQQHADIVGGQKKFIFSSARTIGEIVDSLVFCDVEASVRTGGVPCGNVFVKKEVFERYGYFPEHVRSNGDAIWSRNAKKGGARIVYSDKAIVEYPAKRLWNFIRKSYRVGRGSYFFWKALNYSPGNIWERNLQGAKYYTRIKILQMIANRGEIDMINHLNKIWICLWMGNIARFIGRTIVIAGSRLRREP